MSSAMDRNAILFFIAFLVVEDKLVVLIAGVGNFLWAELYLTLESFGTCLECIPAFSSG